MGGSPSTTGRLRRLEFQQLREKASVVDDIVFSERVTFGSSCFQFVLLRNESLLVFFHSKDSSIQKSSFLIEITSPSSESILMTMNFEQNPVVEIVLTAHLSLSSLSVRIAGDHESSPIEDSSVPISILSMRDITVSNANQNVFKQETTFIPHHNCQLNKLPWDEKASSIYFVLPGIDRLFGPLRRELHLSDLRVLDYGVKLIEVPSGVSNPPLFFVEAGPPPLFFGAVTKRELEDELHHEYDNITCGYFHYNSIENYPAGTTFTGQHLSQKEVQIVINDSLRTFKSDETFDDVVNYVSRQFHKTRTKERIVLSANGVILSACEYPTAEALAKCDSIVTDAVATDVTPVFIATYRMVTVEIVSGGLRRIRVPLRRHGNVKEWTEQILRSQKMSNRNAILSVVENGMIVDIPSEFVDAKNVRIDFVKSPLFASLKEFQRLYEGKIRRAIQVDIKGERTIGFVEFDNSFKMDSLSKFLPSNRSFDCWISDGKSEWGIANANLSQALLTVMRNKDFVGRPIIVIT